jgi:outer membrane immunogenic protein
MAVKAPPPPIAVPLFTWTGFYLGGNLGAAWAQRSVTDVFGNTFTRTSDGRFIGGGQLGYNWQTGNFVLGVEGDIDGIASNNNRSAAVIVGGNGPFVVTSTDTNWVATLAARFGWAADHWLFYGKAGGGWLGNGGGFTVTNTTTGNTFASGGGNSAGGWLLGGGIEYAVSNNWSLKGEYDYIGLSNRNFVVPVVVGGAVVDTFTNRSRSISMFKFGFNYAFR